ncbi:MAG: DUF4209 domain-containing protein [Dehalococcoidia bacterium]
MRRSILATFHEALTDLEANPMLRGFERANRIREVWWLARDACVDYEALVEPIKYELVVWDLQPDQPTAGASHGSRWQAKIEYKDGNHYPNIEGMPEREDFLAYLVKRADETSSLIHRARYADVLWEMQGGFPRAQRAGWAYLDSLPLLNGDDQQLLRVDAIQRALQLGLQLKRQDLTEAARSAIVQELEASCKNSYPPVSLSLLPWLLEPKNAALDPAQLEIGRRYAERAATYYRFEANGRWFLAKDAYSLAADFARRLKDREGEWKALLAAGETLEEEAVRRSNQSRLTEAHFLEEAFKHYADNGFLEKLDSLKIRIREAYEEGSAEYGTIGASVEIDFGEIDAWAERLVGLNPTESLSLYLLQPGRIPVKRQVEAQVQELASLFPFSSRTPRTTISQGRRVATSAGSLELEKAELYSAYKLRLGLAGTFSARIYRRLADADRWTADTVVDFLSSGVAFDQDKLPILRTGIERYFARDYISVIHVLVPQIEDILRRLRGKIGLPTTSTRKGIAMEIALDEVLETEQFKEGLGEDLLFYLKFLYAEQQGENLRNDVAHGIFVEARAREPLATLVVDTLLTLRCISITPADETIKSDTTTASTEAVTLALQDDIPSCASTERSAGDSVPELSSAAWIRVMTDRIVHDFHPLRVILFGSYARGEERADSDIDLLVVFSSIGDKRQQTIEVRKALADIPVGVDIIVADLDDIEERRDLVNDVLYDALRQGRILYDRE